MVAISPPSPSDTRSKWADWLELRALAQARGLATGRDLLGVLDFLEDDAATEKSADADTGEPLDEAILEASRERLVDAAFEELEYRSRLLHECYPFAVSSGPQSEIRRHHDGENTLPGQTVYLFSLLASALRENTFHPPQALTGEERRIADLFQVCACLAAGGYLNGSVSSFGFPRAGGTNFLDALRVTYERFGVGHVREKGQTPNGLPASLKDGGIDVIAWRQHPDGMPGKLYLIGQCASGRQWRDKSVLEYIEQLHGSWFTLSPAKHSTPAMFTPFPFHHDIHETRVGAYLDTVKNRFWHDEMRFGIIFDRLRIAHFAHACMLFSHADRRQVDGTNRFDEIVDWVRDATRSAELAHH